VEVGLIDIIFKDLGECQTILWVCKITWSNQT